MVRTAARLPKGTRISDHVTLGVLTATVSGELVDAVLAETGRQSQRQRQLPARVVVYYVMALALYAQASYGEVLRCLLEGVRWLRLGGVDLAVATKSAITRARTRLGAAPMRALFERLARPFATPGAPGAWYRGHRLVSLDGSTIDLPDAPELEARYGRPGASRGASSCPQLRLLGLAECGTHAIFAVALDRYDVSEVRLAPPLLAQLRPEMLCLADRAFVGFELWGAARATGSELLWRVRANQILPCHQRLADGSYLSCLYASPKHRRHDAGGQVVRVIEYRLEGVPGAEPLYRLITTLLDPVAAPAAELAALYHERWENEGVFAELKVSLPGERLMLRSRRADLVEQEVYGLLLVHLALRQLIYEASRQTGCDPDQLSFLHAVRVVRRHLPFHAAFPPRQRRRMQQLVLIEILAVPAEQSRGRHNPRVVKRKMSRFPTKARAAPAARQVICYRDHIRIVAPAADAAAPQNPRLKPSPKQAEQALRQAFWHDHVRAWRESGLKRAAYAERHGLELRTLNHWIARLRHTFYRHPKAASGRA